MTAKSVGFRQSPGAALEQDSVEQPRYRWYEGLGAAVGAYIALFFIQAAYVTTYTPNYITFLDVIKMMLGID